ncbi:hypothetical protein G7Y79_00013g035680 [Physcia stellaris]|nr:hypothetical protein G7Y79_00013g035680 [Physcia stellaris]
MSTTVPAERRRSESRTMKREETDCTTGIAQGVLGPQAQAAENIPPAPTVSSATRDSPSSYIDFSAPKRIKGRKVIDVTLQCTSDAANRQSRPEGDHSEVLSEKPLSKKRKAELLEEKLAGKRAVIRAKLLLNDTSWVCCCRLPGKSNTEQDAEETSGNCLYDIPPPIKERMITVGELRARKAARDAYDDIHGRCICQEPFGDHPGHGYIMSKAGSDLANDWRQTVGIKARCAFPKPINVDTIADAVCIELNHIFYDFEQEILELDEFQPLNMWAKVEAVAWLLNDDLCCWQSITQRAQWTNCVTLIGVMVLTTIDTLIEYDLFRPDQTVIRNLELVLALLALSTKSACRDDLCNANENGWAVLIARFSITHKVVIGGLDGINGHMVGICDKQIVLEATRCLNRITQCLRECVGLVRMPTEEKLAAIEAKEGETQARKGTGMRTCWMPEDDLDSEGLRLWKRWDFAKEFKLLFTRKKSRGRV